MPIERQQLKPVLERVAAPSFAIDTRGTVRWLNDAAIQLVGDIRGRKFTVAVAPQDLSRLRRRFARRLAEGGGADFQAMLVTRGGGLASCGLSSTVLHREGLVVGVFGVMTRPPLRKHPPPVGPERLTPRQFEVLQLLAGGASTDDMAHLLHLSRETVRNHVQAVLRKLKAKNRLEAVAIARRDALVIQ
jgi:DNA-binding CsgD family transcriptional regulator